MQILRHKYKSLPEVLHRMSDRGPRYLYVEWEDPVFGPRAAAVHKRLQEALDCGASHSLAAISAQMGLVAQLRHIANELKARAAGPPLHAWCKHRGLRSHDCAQALHRKGISISAPVVSLNVWPVTGSAYLPCHAAALRLLPCSCS